jgi:nucleotide-binding universal stress UspA family protein
MDIFNKILFPLDLSEVSPKIATWVYRVAQDYSAELHFLHVVRNFQYVSKSYVALESIRGFEEEIMRGSQKRMKEFIANYFNGYKPYKQRVIIGDASEIILGYIKEKGIKLVIMGTHGRKGLEKAIFGSVADRVVKMATVPVMTINPFRVGTI